MIFSIEIIIFQIILISILIISIYFIVRCCSYFIKNNRRITKLETDFIKLQEKLNKKE